jgi:prolyl 4-hydroxylase
VVQYQQSQEYRAHYDWGVKWVHKAQRHTTFFGILDANCTHCGTQFPDISIDWRQEDAKWCTFVDCEERDMLTFRAVEGSAVFWKNLHEDGRGDVRTLHAGLPVENGTKTGLNIWTIV